MSAFGPFEITDQAGLDTYRAIFEYLYNKLGWKQFKLPRILSDLIDQGRLGLKSEKGFYDQESRNSLDIVYWMAKSPKNLLL